MVTGSGINYKFTEHLFLSDNIDGARNTHNSIRNGDIQCYAARFNSMISKAIKRQLPGVEVHVYDMFITQVQSDYPVKSLSHLFKEGHVLIFQRKRFVQMN